ncbi:oxygenase MpaB family protein [Citromicrobium sp. WPS32]|uniref:oxygenase MpaB family protein n=1 Tax=Citromicrobium sp. WPS32 TaxID=1634517 RepID=UPI0009E9B5B9|nr:oxygenase MpaB family protein [Citromicrobium sp. WPS32]|tara:strand:- start:17807 stop:18901 length:1095 start_codon:yes stop_codon:yes gene_type:complete
MTDQAHADLRRNPNVVSRERLRGPASRWRRHGEPTLAGSGPDIDGGVFGPGSLAWDVLLHPATIVFQSAAQFILQLTYKPVSAGVRDNDPISKKARAGTLSLFDIFDRGQRNSGIHAPMWLGDMDTAKRVSGHLIRIHEKVKGDLIDVGEPALGGYAANSPRDSMWAALTEMHTMLWVYERLAFRNGLPKRLSDEQRDEYIREVKEYCRLFPHNEEDLPNSMAELRALYERDANLFGGSELMAIIPATGQQFPKLVAESIKKNYHPSQFRVQIQLFLQDKLLKLPAMAAVSGKTRRNAGISPATEKRILCARKLMMPIIWLVQQGPVERYFMRMMWGPDSVKLIKEARKLHAAAKARMRQTELA